MSKKHLATPYTIWAIGFVIIPLIMIVYYGFTDRSGAFTLENIVAIADPIHYKSLIEALELSFISTTICLVMAYPLASILSKSTVNKNSIIVLLFILPMWMNFLLRTMAWKTLISKNGVINGVLGLLGLPTLNIINTPVAIIIGMVYNFLPFMVLPIYNALIKIDKDVINAAHDLGANEAHTFLKIILPLTVPGVVSGITMVFVPALTTFVISDLLGGGKINLIGNIIEQEFKQGSNWHLGSGLSLVLMIFIFISMAFTAKFDNEGDGVW